MKLSAKQAEEINKIILNEVKSVMQGRRDHQLLTRQSKLNESYPEPQRIDKAILMDAIDRVGLLEPGDFAAFVENFEEGVMEVIIEAVNQHAVSHVDVDQNLWDELDDMDGDKLMDIQYTAVDEVTEALRTYTEKLIEMVVAVVGGIEADDR